jgi:hypothetical protein
MGACEMDIDEWLLLDQPTPAPERAALPID